MDILLFDMDGVLVEPLGYRFALKETVRQAGRYLGIGEVFITDEQIVRFEALGISSEWHSSALCMAMMVIHQWKPSFKRGNSCQPVSLELEGLFAALAEQPVGNPALKRGVAAIESIAQKHAVELEPVKRLVENSESIQRSPTMNWFQELILGSEAYQNAYRKAPQFEGESYLQLYDRRLIDESLSGEVIRWASAPGRGAAIMTSRPSNGPPGFQGEPDAQLGAALAGLEALPVIGYSEISWLSRRTGQEIPDLLKPGWAHALAAILVASGWTLEDSLAYTGRALTDRREDRLDKLNNSMVIVFEDTPSGMVAVQEAGNLLGEIGLRVRVRAIGIAGDAAKRSALAAQGAVLYANINQALAGLDDFRAFS